MTKLPDISDMDAECLRLGRGVLLTGLRHAVKVLQAQIAGVESQMYVPPPQIDGRIRPAMQRTLDLAGARLATDERAFLPSPLLPRQPKKKRGRPPKELSAKRSKSGKGIKAYWARMTPEERSAEMKRRRAKGQGAKRKAVPTVKLKA